MKNLSRSASISVVLFFLGLGCAGPQKAIDKHFAKNAVGQKYSDLISRSGFKVRVDYGKVLASEPLGDGSTLYVHVQEYESASSTTLGMFGSREYSYRLTGFKVKNDVVEDWAYGLFTPPKKASVLFGFEYGYDHDAAFESIKKTYPDIMKTSSETSTAVWRK